MLLETNKALIMTWSGLLFSQLGDKSFKQRQVIDFMRHSRRELATLPLCNVLGFGVSLR